MIGIVDLRSDTVTQPSPGMRAAMADADVGDDVYREDPTVRALEEHVAAMFGHEAALFAPTGTMANQIAVQALVPAGGDLLCAADAHLVSYETGAAAVLGGITTRTWTSPEGLIDVDTIHSMINPVGRFATPTRVVAVEQTANLPGGLVHPIDRLIRLRTVADRAGIAVHCDGARIWHAHTATGIALSTYGRLFDTLSVCLSKGLGAPAGSLMIGSADLVEHARMLRSRLGGAMRQAGVLAAAGRYALDHHLARLGEDHQRAQVLAAALAPAGVVDPARVHTNIVLLNLSATRWTADAYTAAAAARGVLTVAVTDREVRLVTHRDLTDHHVHHAAHVLAKLLHTPAGSRRRRPRRLPGVEFNQPTQRIP